MKSTVARAALAARATGAASIALPLDAFAWSSSGCRLNVDGASPGL